MTDPRFPDGTPAMTEHNAGSEKNLTYNELVEERRKWCDRYYDERERRLEAEDRAEAAKERVKKLEGWDQDSKVLYADEPNPIERHQAEAAQWKERAEAAEKREDEVRAILVGTDLASLPNDYPLVYIAKARMEDREKVHDHLYASNRPAPESGGGRPAHPRPEPGDRDQMAHVPSGTATLWVEDDMGSINEPVSLLLTLKARAEKAEKERDLLKVALERYDKIIGPKGT